MTTFNEFVQTELPKRPFTETDGAAGQVLVRSGNASHPLELVWVDLPGVIVPTTYTAGRALSGHKMVVLNGVREAIYADNTILAHANIVLGLTKGAAAAGAQVEVIREQELQEPSWNWTVGLPIYLGTDGTLIQSAPVSPALFSLCVGFATATDRMFISVGVPIILA